VKVLGISWIGRRIVALIGVAVSAYGQQKPRSLPPIDFRRDIRPILSDNCFLCHGPDQSTRMADLRLDTKDGAFALRKSGTAIRPGDPSASLVVQRITTAKKALLMPPAHSKKTLSPEQKQLIERWIAEGAPWKDHWAFEAPVRPALPRLSNVRWARNPIDRFILARLEAAGLQPAPEADRRSLARRAALDITGLPPAPEAVEDFVNDSRPQAYERYVDGLLESKQWGEHRARYWLDAARYADTHGIHIDNYREMWPYRDWVISAFNRNLPFDRFVIEQIAGDLLPNPTMEQLIATGFHRCNPTTNEDGAIAEEFEVVYAKDRVDTTGAVFLGLTLGCASCHDHKFDPISQRDFYSFSAFFRNTTQGPFDGNISNTPPILVVPGVDDLPRWEKLVAEEARVRQHLAATRKEAEDDFAKWLDGDDRRKIAAPLEPADEMLSLSVWNGSPMLRLLGKPADVKTGAGVSVGKGHVEGQQAIHFSDNSAIELPNLREIRADEPFSLSTWFYLPAAEDVFVVAGQADPESGGRGFSFEISRRTPSIRLVGQGGRTLTLTGLIVDRLQVRRWYHLAFSYDGKRTPEGFRMFLNGKSVRTQGSSKGSRLNGEIRTFSPFRIGNLGSKFFNGGAISDLRVYARVLSDEDVALLANWHILQGARTKATADLTLAERDVFRNYYFLRAHGDSIDLAAELQSLEADKLAISRRSPITHVLQEKPGVASAHVLFRGMYDQPRDKVTAETPSALPSMPSSFPRNRLGLAQWLMEERNPLTARVTVNRFWQEVFGTGIVRTVDDFGSQGELPSHPELLDWLAVEFRESGWDVKKLYRLLLTSATYRQVAVTTPAKLEIDPANRLLSRGPRFRMDAEMLRDYALAASGLLNPAIGGPPVKPYQPEGVWEAVAMLGSNTRFYRRDSGDKLYRRSLYTFWKRSAPPPALEIFNAPTRENCAVNRERTNTPLQALVRMNDVQYVEAARRLAQGAMLADPSNRDRQIHRLSSALLLRDLNQRELGIVRTAHAEYLGFYTQHLDSARELISQGESKADTSLNPAELAAMTMTASQLMNLDEVLVK
jgi:hypothetical protein